MYCIACGTSLPENARFCPACGERVKGVTKEENSYLHSMRCTSCGSSNLRKTPAGKYRCEHCGTVFYADGKNTEQDEEMRDAKAAVFISEAADYAEKGDYRNELQSLAKAMELAPENSTVLLRLGRAYSRNGLCKKALVYYRMAEELYPDDPVVYLNIGAAFLKQGHYAEAKIQYEKGFAIIESDSMSANTDDMAIGYGNYAFCIGKLGDLKGAKKYLSVAKEMGYSQESINMICKQLHLDINMI